MINEVVVTVVVVRGQGVMVVVAHGQGVMVVVVVWWWVVDVWW